ALERHTIAPALEDGLPTTGMLVIFRCGRAPQLPLHGRRLGILHALPWAGPEIDVDIVVRDIGHLGIVRGVAQALRHPLLVTDQRVAGREDVLEAVVTQVADPRDEVTGGVAQAARQVADAFEYLVRPTKERMGSAGGIAVAAGMAARVRGVGVGGI